MDDGLCWGFQDIVSLTENGYGSNTGWDVPLGTTAQPGQTQDNAVGEQNQAKKINK